MKKGWKRLLATVLAVVMVATSSNAWSMQVVAEGADATVSGSETTEPAQEVTEPTPENTNPTPDTNVEPVVKRSRRIRRQRMLWLPLQVTVRRLHTTVRNTA